MSNLYQINQDYLEILEQAKHEAYENDGEINEITSEMLEQSSLDRDVKIENTAMYIKNKIAYLSALKAEAEMFKSRAVTVENDIKRCKNYLDTILNGEKFETVNCKISWRKSSSVELTVDPIKLPPEYFNTKTEYKADKKKIANKIKSLKEGETFEGAIIKQNRSLTIK
jgi:hypothetical protein